jgi:DNA polymerase-4
MDDSGGRVILHVDMDAFYAQIEQLHHPELRGKPVLVGLGDRRRGVVTTCSYEARAFGVRSGMPIGKALQLCPHAELVPGAMDAYVRYSERIRAVFERFTPFVEPTSIDEAYLDITDRLGVHPQPLDLARKIKSEVRREVDLTCSIGISFNKYMAKIASGLNKPDGLTTIWQSELAEKLMPLSVRCLIGVGPATETVLANLGIYTVNDLVKTSINTIRSKLGQVGEHLRSSALGEDDSPVRHIKELREEKSMSHEQTFEHDISDPELLDSVILQLADMLSSRLKRRKLGCRTVTLKVRFSDFATISRGRSTSEPTDDLNVISEIARELLPRESVCSNRVRLLGVRASQLIKVADRTQMSLFVDPEETRRRAADGAVNLIRSKYGREAVVRAGTLIRSKAK